MAVFGNPAMRARDYQPGEQVPGTVYKVLRLIGAGGMGTVYDVEDTTIGKRYVLKTLRPKLGAREDLARRIQNEARILARLHHPNIVEVITAGITADAVKLPYYLMERLNGQSLRVILEKKGRLDLTHAYHIGIDLLDALDHAHDKSVIHRDVKPDNIYLHRTNAGVTLTKLLDFGIVSMLDQDGETAGRFLGTLRYAAPEQLRGEKPTAKTDIYAAGLVLYEMIAGRGPFDDEGDGNRVAAAHLHKHPLPVSQFVAVPHALDVLLMAALAKNPEVRPRDAFSFAASLRNLKRAIEDAQAREATENRVTASVVLGPESGASLPARTSSSASSSDQAGAHGAASPEARSNPGSHDKTGSNLTGSPKTTLVGMPTPTQAPSLARTGPFASTTIDDGRARGAVTNTVGPDAVPMPHQGTEMLPRFGPVQLENARLGEASTELQWPRDRAPILSDEPQIRSLPAVGAPSRRRRPLILAGIGGAAIVTLVIATHRAPRPAAVASPAVQTAVVPTKSPVVPAVPALAVPVPALTAAVVSVPVPQLPSIAAPAVAPPVVSASPIASASGAPSSKGSAPLAKASARRAPASAPYAVDRPGPGF